MNNLNKTHCKCCLHLNETWRQYIDRKKVDLGLTVYQHLHRAWELLFNEDDYPNIIKENKEQKLKQVDFLITHCFDLQHLNLIQKDCKEKDIDQNSCVRSEISKYIQDKIDIQKEIIDIPFRLIHTCFILFNGGFMTFEEIEHEIFDQTAFNWHKLKTYWDEVQKTLLTSIPNREKIIYTGIANAILKVHTRNGGKPFGE